MARNQIRSLGPADELGLLIGQSISEGLLEGLRSSVEAARAELEPLHSELLAVLHRDLASQLSSAKEQAEELASVLRPCEEGGCDRQAVARGLCRRHYARLTYRERRERQGATVAPRPERALSAKEGKLKKKNAAAIAPIVRRKKDVEEAETTRRAADEPRPRAMPPQPGKPQTDVSVESVARFFGIGK